MRALIRVGWTRTVTMLAVVALLLGTIGVATAAAAKREPASISIGKAKQARALRYWTAERMANAKAYPTPRIRGVPDAGGLAKPDGKASSIAGQAPAGARIDNGELDPGDRSPTVGYPYPFPFSRYYIDTQLYPGVWPYITVGKIFFNQRDAAGVLRSYVCSGASAAQGNVVFTAGHCLNGGPPNPANRWSSSVVFVPAYENGARPYGSFTCNFITVGGPWYNLGDFASDLGACRVGPSNTTGKTLSAAVGWLGFAWNQNRYQHWHAMGYPQAAPFNGQWMTVCTASWAVTDTSGGIGSPDPNGIGCDMTGGSSGGPWIMKFKQNNWINSVNSYKYGSQPLAMYGPYFNLYANYIRCYAATGIWPPPAC